LLPILEAVSDDLYEKIAAASTDFQTARLTDIKYQIDALITSATNNLQGQLFDGVEELAGYESQFASKLLAGMVTVDTASITTAAAMSVITSTPMTLVSGKKVQQLTIDQAIANFSEGVKRDITTLIQAGIIEGETTDNIAKSVRAMVSTRSKAQAEALIRTVANHTATGARNALYEANSDIVKKERFVATLDSQTSLICAGNDGKEFDLGKGPMPPLHYNCRSVRVPVVDPALGLPGLTGERASQDGPVSARLTYSGWLRDQPRAVQDEILGPGRAELFRTGRISLDRFTDPTGKVYSIKTMERADNIANSL
jgi:SPP1 gp7 family putative phage head morphogenesis protein